MDLDQVADELYGLAPADFTAARDEAAGRARRAGDRALAKRIRALRRPTTAAWLANLLVRAHPTETAALLDLGRALRAAQDQLAGAELRDLLVRRHQVVLALVAQALDQARNAGRPAGDGPAQELTETLEAALADPSAAAALAAGHLSTALGPGAEPSLPTGGGTGSRPTAAAEATAASSEGEGRTRGDSPPDAPRPGTERDRSEAEAAEEARLADLAGQVKRARKDAKQAERRAAAAQGEADRAQYAAEESDEAVQRARAALEQARAAYGTTSAAARARREEAATAATRAGEAAAHADQLTRQFEALKKKTVNHGRR
ncbi:hypothetical protein ACFVH7_39585 [Kitasatospora indigofera]|uniref:hypothetical protein n=1 Tax=Kitasatospora indigofera TaxID=67307 RepID=UPI003642CE64